MVALELRDAEIRREKELFYQKAFEEDLERFKAEQKMGRYSLGTQTRECENLS